MTVGRGAVRFDLHPSKWASNGVQMDAKKPRREADTPAFLSWLFLICKAVLSRKRAAALLRHPLEAYTRFASVRFQRVIITDPDCPCCDPASLRSASVPFLSGDSAACPPREGVRERIGMGN